ncbi:hypothetical protein K501DRAFT_279981 [Backusella circina FSU 941]|nr:hypothetical protein K501DRAFT_279981 [Backusella circina FSU 941]
METNEVINNPTASPRTVRSNWLVFSWNQISQASRVLLVLSLSVAVIQIIATIISLCLGKNESCGKPLQSYLIVYVIRVALSFPLLIYQHLFKRRPRGSRRSYNNHNATSNNENENSEHNNNHSESVTHENNSNNNIEESITTSDPVTTSSTIATADTSPSSSYSITSSTDIGNRIQWADRIKSLLDLFAILLFIVGNYLAFSSSSCARQAPTLFYTVLAWILLGYMIVLVPVFICASVIFCLPCVLVAIRTFNVNVSNVIVGGSKEEISKIPIFRYKAPDENDTASTLSNCNSSTHTSSSQQTKKRESSIHTTAAAASTRARKARRYFFNLFNRQHRKSNDDSEQGKKYKRLTITRQEDAVCSICLSDYENDDLICKLWCNHHYHKDCVQEWLELNSKCPLCKRDFRGNDHVSNSDEED